MFSKLCIYLQPLYSERFSERTDTIINGILDNCDLIEITNYSLVFQHRTINQIYSMWNENRFYAWLAYGTVGNNRATSGNLWSDSRPHRRTMVRVLNLVKTFEKQQAQEQQTQDQLSDIPAELISKRTM